MALLYGRAGRLTAKNGGLRPRRADDKQHLIRPWGYLPGHSAEWAKLLMILHRIQAAGGSAPASWLLQPRAAEPLSDHLH
jgi:mannose/cellobiose epimerase-like protein (N-acyl-D-glucosamine 2-epimerase family)